MSKPQPQRQTFRAAKLSFQGRGLFTRAVLMLALLWVPARHSSGQPEGAADVVLAVDGKAANTVRLNLK